MMGSETDDIINELIDSLLQRRIRIINERK